MVKTITVPADGESKAVQVTGASIIILSGPIYAKLTDFAKISFNDPGYELPAVPRSTYVFDGGCFERLVVTGTAESSGDVIEIMTTKLCLESRINMNILETVKAIAGNTFNKTMDGTVQQITELELVDANGNLPRSVYLSASGGNINYRWNDGGGTDPAEAGKDFIFVDAAKPIEYVGIDFILKLRFINSVNLEVPDLVIEPRY